MSPSQRAIPARPTRRDSHLPSEVGERLGPWYVYVLVDPQNVRPFYVGKGTGDRLLAHGVEADKAPERDQPGKVRYIRDLRKRGVEPRIDIVRRGLGTEAEAYRIEAALIDCLPGLVNVVRGHGSEEGRETLDELVAQYGAKPIGTPGLPALLIRLGPWRDEHDPHTGRRGVGYRVGIEDADLYNSTRAWWRASRSEVERRGIRHFVAVYRGVSRAIYEIGKVVERSDGRIGFTGTRVTRGPAFDDYVGPLGKRVDFPTYSQNPVTYWPPG